MDSQEAAYMPNRLCNLCEEFVRRNNYFQFSVDTTGAASADDLFYDCTVEHYANIEELVQAAEKKICHLCSVLLGWILKNGDEFLQEAIDRSERASTAPLTSWVSGIAHPIVSDSPEDNGWMKFEFRLYQNFTEAGEDARECLAWTQVCHKPGIQPRVNHEDRSGMKAYTGSGAVYKTIERWLQQCQSSHANCKPDSQQDMPTRLLDLQVDGTQDIKVVAGTKAAAENASYASLSYCWGLVPQTKLTTQNYHEFCARINFKTLPKTMQHAVIICRGLSVRYLWIDALCIIQGPDGDFQQEASRMMSVYAGSLFTVCAADSTDSSGGCLFNRNPLCQLDCQVAGTKHHTTYIKAFYPCKRKSTVPGASPLNSRGWVFQESLLSPRSLYFSRSGVHWECREGVACELSPHFSAKHGESVPLKRNFAGLCSPSSDSTASSPTSPAFANLWNSILEGYSVTRLSFTQDRLIAMAGIASSIQKRFEDNASMTASFGLWLPTFLDQLLWGNAASIHDQSEPRSPSLAIAPSWSWVNVGGSQEVTSLTTILSSFEDDEESYELLEERCAELIKLPPATGFTDPLPSPAELLTRKYAVALKAPLVQCRYWRRTNPAPARWNMPGHQVITKHCLDPMDDGPAAAGARAKFGDDLFLPDYELTVTDDGGNGMLLFCALLKRQYYKKRGDDGDAVDYIFDCGIVLTPLEEEDIRRGGRVVYRRVGAYSEVQHPSSHCPGYRALKLREGRLESYMHMFFQCTEEQNIDII